MVDGTHISLAAPFDTPADNHYRKGLFSKNLQVVDWTMRIRDMCLGWPDSVHDARVCTHSTAYRLASLLPYGLFVLGDAAVHILCAPIYLSPSKI